MVIIAIDNCSLNGIVSCILKKCFMSNLKTGTLVHKRRQYICLFQPKVVGVIVFLLEKNPFQLFTWTSFCKRNTLLHLVFVWGLTPGVISLSHGLLRLVYICSNYM